MHGRDHASRADFEEEASFCSHRCEHILEVDFVSNCYKIALSLRNILIKCGNRVETLTFKCVPFG
jgi:hypothetical protein